MDKLDFLIFRGLTHDPRSSPMQTDIRKSLNLVAKGLHVDENTVRNRLEKFKESGFLQGWVLVVNPNLLGMLLGVMWFEVRSRPKDEAIRKLAMIPGLVVIVDYFGDFLVIVLLCEDQKGFGNAAKLAGSISRARGLAKMAYHFPVCDLRLSETDWEIIESIHRSPAKQFQIVAQELSISTRTVKRRLCRMIDGNAIFTLPSMNPAKLKGAILADVFVSYEEEESKAKMDQLIAAQLSDYLLVPEVNISDYGAFHLWLDSLSLAKDVKNMVEGLPGVKEARVDLVQTRVEHYGVLEDAVRAHLRKITV